MRIFYLLLSVLYFLPACRGKDARDPHKIVRLGNLDMNDIYLDYRLTANEGDDNLNLVLQFREYDKDGSTLYVGGEGKVLLDGEELKADSAEMSGAFYEIQKPIASFSGEHEIVLEAPGRRIVERFHFQPMTLAEALPDTVRRAGGWDMRLDGVENGDPVRIMMLDTSFFNDEINRLDTVRQGRIRIRPADLEKLHDGPIQFELYRELDRPTVADNRAGGRFSRTFALRRSFVLVD